MSDPSIDRVEKLFFAMLEIPPEQRDSWLIDQCGEDQELLVEVGSLLKHDSPLVDPLENGIDEVIDLNQTLLHDESSAPWDTAQGDTAVDGDQFLDRLADVGILSEEEISAIEQELSGEAPSSDPHLLASQLVTEGKLTEYQARALLNGRPNLLIDKYLILDLIGMGGMGTVFKALHRPMNRIVAIKMISKHLLVSERRVRRFQREVRVAATLENVNIVRAYDADHSSGVHFLVMEYVRGEDLAKVVKRDGPMAVEHAVECILQAANGLHYAHERGVVHRDIKPGNLMKTKDGLVKVVDLGLADADQSFQLATQESDQLSDTPCQPECPRLTQVGAVLGTVSFMAPEQSRDAELADSRSDIYSLGCTLYFILVGEPPFKGDVPGEVIRQHREAAIPSMRELRPDVPEAVCMIYEKMLAKDPGDRYQTIGELIHAVGSCGVGRSAKPTEPTDVGPSPITDLSRTHQAWRSQEIVETWINRILLTAILLVVLVGATYLIGSSSSSDSKAIDAEKGGTFGQSAGVPPE